MHPNKHWTIVISTLIISINLFAQTNNLGTITGSVIDESSDHPIEYVNVVVHNKFDSTIVTGKVSDKKGRFDFTNVPVGEYYIKFSLIGYKEKTTPNFKIDSQHKHLNLGKVTLVATTVDLDEVLVTAEKSMFNNSIDRKVYNADQDLMSKAGSASELLQKVPSVQVDIDGNVSLRGSSNVLFMMNGKTSPLLQKNSAEVLQQMPASSIEKIEVITNPSAKYKPDGTSGIINIVLKKNTSFGINGNLTGNVGNQSRYNGNIRLNYNPGNLNVYGSYSLRKDNRNRINTDTRTMDAASVITHYRENLKSYASPLSHMFSLGLDYHIDNANQFGISGNYFYNSFTRTDNSNKVQQDSARVTTEENNRYRLDYEYEKEYGFTTYFEHNFPKEDQKLRLEYTISKAPEQEDNRYTNIPAYPYKYDNALIINGDNKSQLSLDYSNPLTDESNLEAGYSGEFNSNDRDYHIDNFDTTQLRFVKDTLRTNRFRYDESIQALYATFKHSIGNFGLLAGLRTELAYIKSNLVTTDSTITNDYFKIFPTLHLSYKFSKAAELQLSYSKRTRRPEGEDLNPFPEYRDRYNVSAGNPKLLPEYIHSVEFGCQFQNDEISVLPAVYYRYTYNRFTSITKLRNDGVLLTTRENLSNDQSGGLEVIVSANLGDIFTVHASANEFYNKIDASSLGYSQKKSITSWSGALTLNFNFTNTSRLQINSNYNSSRLTPQGESKPSYVINTGFRQELFEGKLSLILTVADIFKTLKRQLELNLPSINQTVINTRDSRIIYFGFTYHFGAPPKKSKDEQLKYDDSI